MVPAMAKKGSLMAGNAVASDDDSGDDSHDDSVDETPDRKSGPPSKKVISYKTPSKPFFTIYKKGQGKWTRLGTAFAAGLLAALTAYNVYFYVLPYLPVAKIGAPDNSVQYRRMLLAGCAGVLVVLGLLTFWIGNKPSNVDFMIATDGEMKKVNWTTKGELFGSTRVVILFLVFIGVFLFLVDVVFSWFFHLVRVLQ
jgi:preprotein translocase SecE subunit